MKRVKRPKNLHVRLSELEAEWLELLALKQGYTSAELVRAWIREKTGEPKNDSSRS